METSEEHLEGMWGRGFTSDASTIHAEILIRDTKTYYNAKKNSPVFVCSFDTKKAFDCCNWHFLPETVSKFQLKVYINGETATRYKNNISNPFNLSQGVRQGSLLSPYLCNIYTADLIDTVQQLNIGTYLPGNINTSIIACADYIILLSPTLNHFQKMVNKCVIYGLTNGLNVSTSCPGKENVDTITIYNC